MWVKDRVLQAIPAIVRRVDGMLTGAELGTTANGSKLVLGPARVRRIGEGTMTDEMVLCHRRGSRF